MFALTCTPIYAQNVVVSGYVKDAKTGERLIGAYISSGPKRAAITNDAGFFSLALPSGDTTLLSISFVGYQKQLLKISGLQKTIINVRLRPDTVLQAVEIRAENPIHGPQMSTLQIPITQIRKMPALMGEVDVMRAFQLMPGVQGGREGTSGLHVRGGSPDQNLILIDDVPLYYVNHIGGFVSVFDVNALQDVKLIKGGFPARYGGRLSSVLDIKMKEGKKNRIGGQWQLGVLSSKISLDGPIYNDKTTFLFSVRRCNLDLPARVMSLLPSSNQVSGYTFYDIHGKVSHQLSAKDKISLSLYQGRDRIFTNQKEQEDLMRRTKTKFKDNIAWGNQMLALHWNRAYTPRLFGTMTLAYTRFFYKIDSESSVKKADDNALISQEKFGFESGIRDFMLKADYEYWLHQKHKLRFGANAIAHRFRPGINQSRTSASNAPTRDTTTGTKNIHAQELSVYVESISTLSSRLSANPGLHLASYIVGGQTFTSLQPRLSMSYMLSGRSALKASVSKMTQFMHLLSSSGAGQPVDLWVPATARLRPENSWQTALGFTHTPANLPIEATIEAFYKQMDNLIEFREGASFFGTGTNWQDKVEAGGTGEVYGLEILLQKKQGRTTGWLGYTYAHNNRQFENLNAGRIFPYRYDRRHSGSLVVSHRINKKISVSGTWVYETGNAFTLATQRYDYITPEQPLGSYPNNFSNESEVLIYGGRNGYRMPAYHRLDLSADFRKPTRRGGEQIWNLSFYNAYNRRNPFYLYFKQDNQGYNRLYMFSLFPIFPSVSYRRRF